MRERETLEGYVLDQACVRKYPQDELHTTRVEEVER